MNKYIFLSLGFFSLLATDAKATSRLFSYTYESKTLSSGEIEIEPWVTSRIGHQGFFHRMDQRLEIETGLTDRLQTAFYLNTSAKTQDTPTGRVSEYEFEGVSSEWKYKFSDASTDSLGFALYVEGTLSDREAEIEQKFIFDKDFGNWVAALNLTTEYEWNFSGKPIQTELILEATAGLSYPLTDSLSLGLEMKNHNKFPSAETFSNSALFLGPVVNYNKNKWWATLTVLPQVFGFRGATEDHLVLGAQERMEVRLLFGIHI